MGAEFDNLHQVLRTLYTEMMPMCGDMIGVAKGIAGLGALFYVALRVWQTLARAEPIDVYPLLRPFALGLCILFFPMVLETINGVLSPIVQGTHKMLEKQTFSMDEYRKLRDKLEYEAMVKNPETAYLVSNEEFDKKLDELGIAPSDMATMAGMYVERSMYNLKKWFRNMVRELLELLFAAAALLIDTLRTFFLIVLSILGPIAFAISVWDGFQSTLTQWFTRYISIYLWLPVADLFSSMLAKIQELMLKHDITQLLERSVPRLYDYRHHRLLHHSHGCGLGDTGRWSGELRQERELRGRKGCRYYGSRCRSRRRFRRRTRKTDAA